jgi:carbon-monoxide dehydrogenase large subunit
MPDPLVGQSLRRIEDPPLLAGRGRFLDDLRRPGMLTVAFVRSPHAHARVLGVTVEAALAVPGVVAALTGEDARHLARPFAPRLDAPGYRATAWPVLATDRVRFVGEAVAAVVAADRYVAEDAAGEVRARYEPLPPVTDAERAMEPGAARLHDGIPGNVVFHAHFDNGHAEAAFAQAEVRFAETFRHPRCAAVPMEGRGIVAEVDPASGQLTVWASSQVPHILRTGLAEALGLPESSIRVVAPDVGGGFGPKMHVFPEDVVVCLLARRLGRPVKWAESRTENLMAGAHAREHVNRIEIAARRDGTLLGIRTRLVCDVGAYSIYPTTAALEPVTAAGLIPGPYRVRGYAYDAYGVATNKCPTGAYRGVGQALATFVRERAVAMLAGQLGLDVAEVQRRNFVRPDDFPFATASGLVFDSGSPGASLERLLELTGYEALRAEPRGPRADGTYRGVGLASYTEFTGMGAAAFKRRGMAHVPGFDSATVRVEPSGEARAFVSAASQGQGHRTTLAQLLADEIGLGLEAVAIVAGDTERCPYGSGAFASRTIVAAGGALALAARTVREKVLRIAAHLLEAAPEDLVCGGGEVAVRGAPARRLTFRDIAAVAYCPPAASLPPGLAPGLEATRYYDPPPATFSNGAHLAVVEVDPETGVVRVLRHAVVEDCGRMVNPQVVEGQIHGAVTQGIGNALHEAVIYDDSGQLVTANLMEYHLPTAAEIPSIEIAHVTTLPPGSVAGFKGMAEGGTIGATAAVANAVADALLPLGVTVRDLPLTPHRVYRLLHERPSEG